MKVLRFICLFAFLGVIAMDMFSQQDNKIVCLAQVKKDSVVLRWVPASIPVWQMGVKYGYMVERFTIAKGGQPIPDGLSKSKLLTTLPIKPISNEAFEELIKKDSGAAVVQEAIYGSDFQPLTTENNFQTFMKAYNDLEVRFGFALFMCDLSSSIAQAAGLRFTDREISPDERYAYRVSLINIPEGMTLEPAVIVLDAGSITKLPPVTDVQATFLDKTVKLRWPIMIHKGIFTAYILEKSSDGLNYKSVSDLPLINVTEKENTDYFVYTDSLKRNEEPTWYRVKGISPFGEEGPASQPLKGEGKPEFSAYAVIDSAEVLNNSQIVVHWRVTESMAAPVKEIQILRAFKPDGLYEPLSAKPLASSIRVFTDPKPGISNYYKIQLFGNGNLKSESFPYLVQTEDNDPPSPPQMLTGKVDTSGIVTIAWKSNTEPDIKGYRVFRANASFEEFISLGNDITPDNQYRDTINLNTLTSKIYYKVVAVDKHYNNSDYSGLLELTRPDTICPAPAVITSAKVVNGKVQLLFEESPSSDINYYELYRETENDSTSIKILSLKNKFSTTYEDEPEKAGINYIYTLKTFDLSGNVSANKRSIFLSSVSASPKPLILKASKSKNGKSIILRWELPTGFQSAKTTIYRGKEKEPVSIYVTLQDMRNSFEDSDIELNTNYTYKIRILSKSGEVLSSGLPTKVQP